MSVPSVHLKDLIKDLDFLAAAKRGEKPNFKSHTYSDASSYFTSVSRAIAGECQVTLGNARIQSICTNASQTYTRYKDDKTYGPLLMDKIVAARTGLVKIKQTYNDIGKESVARDIETDGIFTLDLIIPESRKFKEDIILNQTSDPISTARTEVPSSDDSMGSKTNMDMLEVDDELEEVDMGEQTTESTDRSEEKKQDDKPVDKKKKKK